MKNYKYPSVLTIAGFDGSGGAGQQADIKTISALGCFATCALTSLPIQNTQGVKKIYPIPIRAVREQIQAVMEDILPDAIKIGMIHSATLAKAIVNTLKKYPKVPVVYDPVMVATSGDKLIEEKDIGLITSYLFPFTDLITPNMDEAATLAKMSVTSNAEMLQAGKQILEMKCNAVLIKGGHQKTKILSNYLIDKTNNSHQFKTPHISTSNTHGTGCTLSSAIASYLAQGANLYNAVELGQQYTYNAINQGKDVVTGKGSGPLNHFFNPKKSIKNVLN